MLSTYRMLLEQLFVQWGMNADGSGRMAQILIVLLLFLLAFLFIPIYRYIIVPVIEKFVEKSETKWDDALFDRRMLYIFGQVVPGIIVVTLLPQCYDSNHAVTFVVLSRLTKVYLTLVTTWVIYEFIKRLDKAMIVLLNKHDLKGIFQFVQMITVCLGAITAISLFLGYNPIRFIAGLGAVATVLMLVFKDTIVGLVAGIQLTVNKMLDKGDWITIPKLNINGYVEEISLTTVKVRNFDNSISTIPPYTLVSDTFQNWRGIHKMKTRRLKRALYIDVHSIRTVDQEELEEIQAKFDGALSSITDVRAFSMYETPPLLPTNLTLFRHFATSILENDPQIAKEKGKKDWVLVRQLEPTPTGLPLEFWFYAQETDFVRFEDLASQYMEYFIAALPHFGLRLFQSPTGHDLENLAHSIHPLQDGELRAITGLKC